MAKEKIKLFRSQMGGFNREDVNNYIKETDLKHAEEISSLTAKLDEITAKVDALTQQYAALEEANQKLTEEKDEAVLLAKEAEDALSAKNAEIADVTKKLDFYKSEAEAQINVMNNLKTENKRLAAELENSTSKSNSSLEEEIARLTSLSAEKDAIIVSLNDEIERVNAENIALSATSNMGDISDSSSPAYKLDMYNKISSQLGDILINANRSAEDIVSAARQRSEQMIADAEDECEKKKEAANSEAEFIRKRIAEISSNILSSVSGDLHGNIENCMKEISTCVDDMQYEIKTIMSKLSARSLEMNDKVVYYQNNATECVDKKLSEMDAEYSAVLSRSEEENV